MTGRPTATARAASRHVLAVLIGYPFSIALLGTVLGVMAATRADPRLQVALQEHLALGWHDLVRLELWRLPLSQLVQDHPGWVVSNIVLLSIVPVAEHRLGTRLAVVLFFVGDWASTLPALVGARAIAALTGSRSLLHAALERGSGSSAGAWALLAGYAWSLDRGRVRTAVLSVELFVLLGFLAGYHRGFDLQHVISAAAGIAIVECSRRRGRVPVVRSAPAAVRAATTGLEPTIQPTSPRRS